MGAPAGSCQNQAGLQPVALASANSGFGSMAEGENRHFGSSMTDVQLNIQTSVAVYTHISSCIYLVTKE